MSYSHNVLVLQDGSLDLDSRYGCTEPPEPSPDDTRAERNTCGVSYGLPRSTGGDHTIASVKIGEPALRAVLRTLRRQELRALAQAFRE